MSCKNEMSDKINRKENKYKSQAYLNKIKN